MQMEPRWTRKEGERLLRNPVNLLNPDNPVSIFRQDLQDWMDSRDFLFLPRTGKMTLMFFNYRAHGEHGDTKKPFARPTSTFGFAVSVFATPSCPLCSL